MSKEYKNIDELFQAEMGQGSVQAPAHVKANIDKALGFKNNRAYWLFIIPLLAIGIVTTVLVVNSNNGESNDQALNETSITSENQNSQEESHTENITSDVSLNNTNNQDNLQSDSDYQSVNILSQDEHTNNHSKDNSQNVQFIQNHNKSHQDQILNDKPLRSVNKGDINAVIGNQELNPNNIEAVSQGEKNTEIANTVLNDKKLEDDINPTKEDEVIETTDDKITADVGVKEEIVLDNTNDTIIDSSDEIVEEKLDDIDSAKTETVEEIDSTLVGLEEPDEELDQKPDAFKPWFASMYGGVSYKLSKFFVDTSDVNYQESISDKLGFSVGLSGNYMFKNGLFVGSGVEFSSYREDYNYQKIETIAIDTTFSWNVFVYDSIPDSTGWIYLYDSTQTATPVYGQQDVYNGTGVNQTTYLHIPFRIGDSFMTSNKKWRFDIYLQGRLNLLLRSTSTYVLNDQLISNTNGSLKNTSIDFELGFSSHYALSEHLFLSGMVKVRPGLFKNPYYSEGIKNKYTSCFLGAGLTYNF